MSEAELTVVAKTGKRPYRVNVRFSHEEYGYLREQCRIVNRSPAHLLRSLAAGVRLRPVPRLPEEVQRALKSFGGNLNQLAHQANMGRVDRREVGALREGIGQLLRVIGAR
jgi:hypothetical protein